jgi:hypothetical protein
MDRDVKRQQVDAIRQRIAALSNSRGGVALSDLIAAPAPA